MQYFDFSGLIEKYSNDFEVITEGKSELADNGEYIKGEQTVNTMHGAILSYGESKIFRSEGTLTKSDRILLMLKPIEGDLKSAKVNYDGKIYSIESNQENAEFTGVWQYNLKFISAFDKGREE